MKLSRRSFLGMGGASALGSAVAMFGLPMPARADSFPEMKTLRTKETTTICPYCGVGCGLVVATRDGELVNIEGDADHPINEGALCSKGMSLYQVAKNDRRLDKVRYRAAGSSDWEEKSWDWAMKEIAKRVKKTRDKTFITNEGHNLVNRAHGLACLGGAALDNEECYMLAKLARGMGITFIEHQARI